MTRLTVGVFSDVDDFVEPEGTVPKMRKIKIVRVGNIPENSSDLLKSLSLDNQINVELEKLELWSQYQEHLRNDPHSANGTRISHHDWMDWNNRKGSFETSINKEKQKLRATILKEAQVVGTTLNSSGQTTFLDTIIQENLTFPTVIVDEAGQTTEPGTLIPMRFGCRKLILVGDPRQLPPTVLSRTAKRAGLNRSLFERLERAEHEVVMLSIQYRMHPEIRSFPSKYFYNNLLEDSPAIEEETASNSHHIAQQPMNLEDGEILEIVPLTRGPTPPPLPILPVREIINKNVTSSILSYLDIPAISFFDSGSFRQEIAETKQGTSYVNVYEIQQIISFLVKILPYLQDQLSIGIISPYKAQIRRILDACGKDAIVAEAMRLRTQDNNRIEVNTVDGFQGREKDIVIFSCVRANGVHASSSKSSSGEVSRGSVLNVIGFVADERRLNVAITRAKKSLVIFGHSSTLQLDPIWKAMIESFRERGAMRDGGYQYPSLSDI